MNINVRVDFLSRFDQKFLIILNLLFATLRSTFNGSWKKKSALFKTEQRVALWG